MAGATAELVRERAPPASAKPQINWGQIPIYDRRQIAMARLPRLTVPGYPHHIIQRGNNRQAIFAGRPTTRAARRCSRSMRGKLRVAVHAYVLMSNHFHLLATPETAEGIPQMMQAVGRRYVRYFNRRQARTGTLWEGRYRSTLIQAERYLLACMVYIDLNPVRAGMVADPGEYPWSSHAHYVGRAPGPADHAASDVLGTWATRRSPAKRPTRSSCRSGIMPQQRAGAHRLGIARLGAGRPRLRCRAAEAYASAGSPRRRAGRPAGQRRSKALMLSPIKMNA